MKRKLLAIFCLFLVLSASLRPVIVYAAFKANQDYIARALCINQESETITTCKGSCYLSEQLSDAKPKNEHQHLLLELMEQQPLLITMLRSVHVNPIIAEKKENILLNWKLPVFLFAEDNFHPPQFLFV